MTIPMKNIIVKLTFIFILVSSTSIVYGKTQKVLVLHSYHQGLEWTDNITAGIKSILGTKESNIEVYYDYLDTKRNTGPAYENKLIELFRAKKQQASFDLVITSDNNALNFMRLHGADLYPNTPIVFCGVNFFTPDLIAGMEQVTGVTESADVKSTIELMLNIHPDTEKILVVLDKTLTGLAIRKNVEVAEQFFKDRVSLEYYTDFSWENIGKDLASLGSHDLIYLLTINRDKNNKFISYIDGIDLINKSAHVPIYGSWDFYLGQGIVGGVITSGFAQGQQAAKYAQRILSGESIKNIPIDKNPINKAMFDFIAMNKHGISKNRLPNSAIIINQPTSLLEKSRSIPKWLIFIPILAILILISYLFFLKTKQQLIVKANADLDKRVQNKTEELHASNKQLNVLINTLPTPVFYKNLSSEFQTCNEAFARIILGINKEEVIGRTLAQLSNLVSQKTLNTLENNIETQMTKQGAGVYETKILCADGKIHNYLFHTAQMLDNKYYPTGIIAAMTDISEQHSAQKEKEELINSIQRDNNKLKTMAIMDAVTNIFNRRYISQKLTDEYKKANRLHTPLSVVMFDIDHFKVVNDNFGHQFGDLVLHEICQVMKSVIRNNDFIGRYGGEEFLLILPNASMHKAKLLSKRIRKIVELIMWNIPGLKITISGGVAEYTNQTEKNLLKDADICLYQAKATGRNKIVCNKPSIFEKHKFHT